MDGVKGKSFILRVLGYGFSITFVKAEHKGDYFDGKKVGLSIYEEDNSKGISFSLFRYAVFLLVRKRSNRV